MHLDRNFGSTRYLLRISVLQAGFTLIFIDGLIGSS